MNIGNINPVKAIGSVDSVKPVGLSPVLKPEAEEATENPLMVESFEKVLAKALQPVNQLQLDSADLDAKLASGKLEYVHQAMVMGEKASLALELTIQVRNKIIEAYQEIMRTQV